MNQQQLTEPFNVTTSNGMREMTLERFIAAANEMLSKPTPTDEEIEAKAKERFNILPSEEINSRYDYHTYAAIQEYSRKAFIQGYKSALTTDANRWVSVEELRNKLSPVANLIALIELENIFDHSDNDIHRIACSEISLIKSWIESLKK